jgi:hypothetical protein
MPGSGPPLPSRANSSPPHFRCHRNLPKRSGLNFEESGPCNRTIAATAAHPPRSCYAFKFIMSLLERRRICLADDIVIIFERERDARRVVESVAKAIGEVPSDAFIRRRPGWSTFGEQTGEACPRLITPMCAPGPAPSTCRVHRLLGQVSQGILGGEESG